MAFVKVRREMAECGAWLVRRQIYRARNVERAAQLVDIVFIGQRWILVEPFRNHELRGRSFRFAAVIEPDTSTDKRLHALRHSRGSEAKRHPVMQRPLKAVDRCDAEGRCRT